MSMFKLSRRLEFLLGANGQPGSMAIGNTLMLLMKPPTAQGGSAFSFPHLGITKVRLVYSLLWIFSAAKQAAGAEPFISARVTAP